MALVQVPTGGGSGTTSYFHGDHLGSTRVLTDANGLVEETNIYLPFGETYLHQGTSDVAYKYTGQEIDPTTGLYFYQARYYDATLGRFLSPDTIVPNPLNPQSLNRYSYVLNNPVKFTDPTGHWSFGGFFRSVGRAISRAFNAVTSFIRNVFNFGRNLVRRVFSRPQRVVSARVLSSSTTTGNAGDGSSNTPILSSSSAGGGGGGLASRFVNSLANTNRYQNVGNSNLFLTSGSQRTDSPIGVSSPSAGREIITKKSMTTGLIPESRSFRGSAFGGGRLNLSLTVDANTLMGANTIADGATAIGVAWAKGGVDLQMSRLLGGPLSGGLQAARFFNGVGGLGLAISGGYMVGTGAIQMYPPLGTAAGDWAFERFGPKP